MEYQLNSLQCIFQMQNCHRSFRCYWSVCDSGFVTEYYSPSVVWGLICSVILQGGAAVYRYSGLPISVGSKTDIPLQDPTDGAGGAIRLSAALSSVWLCPWESHKRQQTSAQPPLGAITWLWGYVVFI